MRAASFVIAPNWKQPTVIVLRLVKAPRSVQTGQRGSSSLKRSGVYAKGSPRPGRSSQPLGIPPGLPGAISRRCPPPGGPWGTWFQPDPSSSEPEACEPRTAWVSALGGRQGAVCPGPSGRSAPFLPLGPWQGSRSPHVCFLGSCEVPQGVLGGMTAAISVLTGSQNPQDPDALHGLSPEQRTPQPWLVRLSG